MGVWRSVGWEKQHACLPVRTHISWFDLQLWLRCQVSAAGPQDDHKRGGQLNPGAGRRIASPQGWTHQQGHRDNLSEADLKQSQHLVLLLLQRHVEVLLSPLVQTIFFLFDVIHSFIKWFVWWSDAFTSRLLLSQPETFNIALNSKTIPRGWQPWGNVELFLSSKWCEFWVKRPRIESKKGHLKLNVKRNVSEKAFTSNVLL